MFFDPRPTPPWQQRVYGKWGLAGLLLAFLLVGTVGHDPWRGADLRHFFAVWQVLQGEWLLPTALVDGTVPAAAPLYYWVAALLGMALEPLGLALHDATRLASPLFVLISLGCVAMATLPACGKPWHAGAVLLGLGTLGWMLEAHQHQALLASTATLGMTLAGAAWAPHHPARAWLCATAGFSLGFLAQGFAILPVSLIPWLATFPAWSIVPPAKRLPLALVTVALLALPVAWLMAVLASPNGSTWLALQTPHIDPVFIRGNLLDAGNDATWVTWPLWLLALWPLRRASDPRISRLSALNWAILGAGLIVVAIWPPSNPSDLLILLPSLTLLATTRLKRMPRGAQAAFSWFSVATAITIVVLTGLAWSALHSDWPPGLARHVARVAPEFEMSHSFERLILAGILLFAWVVSSISTPASPLRPTIHWALSVSFMWSMLVVLLAPWFEHTRNFRPIIERMQPVLQAHAPHCVSVPRREPDVRAALIYFAGVPAHFDERCPIRFERIRSPQALQPDSSILWSMSRGQEKRQEIWLLRINTGSVDE
jgi:hypothetical protein